MRLDGYIRVSRVAGRSGESFIAPTVQREKIAKFSDLHSHQVVEWWEDLDEPGSKANRPGFQQALARVERGETDGIIVAKLDRFARSLSDAVMAIRRIRDAGGQVVSVEDNFDSSTPMGRFAVHMILALAELELDRIRENWSTAQANAVDRGVHIASRTPTGYRRSADGRLEPDPVAAPVVRELFRRRAGGAGWSELADFMDASGVSGPYGNRTWGHSTLAKMIRNRVYLGEARSGRHVKAGAHEALVTRTEWEAAQGARPGPSPRNGEGLLLSGLVRCAGCRYVVKPDTMRGRGGERLGLYRCRRRHPAGTCPAPATVMARVLEPYVEQRFLEALGPRGPLAEASASTKALDEAMQRVEAAEQELNAYRDSTAASIIGNDSFLAGLETRAQALDAARQELAAIKRRSALAPPGLTPGRLVDAWPTLTTREKRALLSAAIDAVVVRAARGSGRNVPVDDRTLILWRGDAPADLPRRGLRPPLASFTWPRRGPRDVGMAGGEDGQPGTLDGSQRRRRKMAATRHGRSS